ncbi:MAG: CotH kinase family protein, partial [Bacteroidales bacterium]|nr:CotH kinase family protein [Bacteroidales bacterium]
TDVHVSSILLKANGEEPISGKGTISVSSDGIPAVTMDESASDSIMLNCGDILLGSSRDECTEFWFALPPVAFTRVNGGFTITVSTTDGKEFTQTASIDLSVKRKTVERMQPLKVVPKSSAVTPNLNAVSSTRANVEYEAQQIGDTLMLTIPTVTDFSQLVIDFDIDGDSLTVDGNKVISGVTPIDASTPLSLVVCSGDAQKEVIFKARNTGLPVVRIETSDYFSLNDLESYPNSLQSADDLDHRVWLPEGEAEFVSIRIEQPDGTPGMRKNNTGDPVYEIDTKIRGRGNYTWTWAKKPYALRFDKKTEVLGMPAHKRWILLANWRDHTLLRNDAAFWLSRQAGLPYTVRGQFVELEFNGEHRGNYYLCEQIKVDENRVNITEIDYGELGLQNPEEHTGGYLMEIDSYFDEVNKFESNEFSLKYMFKEPDEEKLTETDSLYMAKYINDFEKVLKTRSGVEQHEYEDYLNVESAIKFMLVNELAGNRDFFQGPPHNGPHSTYLFKDQGGKLFMGPVWDFDYETFIPAEYYNNNNNYKWRGFDNPEYYFYWMCADDRFVSNVKTIWSAFKSSSDGFTDYIDDMVRKIGLSQQFDDKIWPYQGERFRNDNHDFDITYDEAIERMKTSFTTKSAWIDGKINNLGTTNPNFKYQ